MWTALFNAMSLYSLKLYLYQTKYFLCLDTRVFLLVIVVREIELRIHREERHTIISKLGKLSPILATVSFKLLQKTCEKIEKLESVDLDLFESTGQHVILNILSWCMGIIMPNILRKLDLISILEILKKNNLHPIVIAELHE